MPVSPLIQSEIYQNAYKKEVHKARKEKIVKNLIYIMEKNIDVFPPSSLKAIETLNKMLGYNEPDKVDVKQSFNLEIPGVNDNSTE
jgi:hypothetical protein